MQNRLRFMMPSSVGQWLLILGVALVSLGIDASDAVAGPIFNSTDTPSSWQVSTHVFLPEGTGNTGSFSSFLTSEADFHAAVAVTGRPHFIANNEFGTNDPESITPNAYTYFVFRQTFDLTAYDPNTAQLAFRWAADDGTIAVAWAPKFRLNGGSLQPGNWPSGPAFPYDLGNPQTVSTGFITGLNTIEFFVEGNGVTDGFALTLDVPNGGLSAQPLATNSVPEPSSLVLLSFGSLALIGAARRKRKPSVSAA